MARQLKDWIASYKEYYQKNEAPQLFHQWSAVSAIASAARRNVWLDFGYFKYYPNMYIVLVGPPASKKTTAMFGAKKFLRYLGPKIKFAHDSTTREKLIGDLSEAYLGELGYSAVTAYSPEFGNMLQSSQAAMIDFLTGIFDYEDEDFVHGTVGRGEIRVVNPFLNLLACTTDEFVHRSLPAYAIGTGFTSRVLFVYSDKIGTLVPRPALAPEQLEIRTKLVADLKHISEVKGEMVLTEEAGIFYDEWYCSRRQELEQADIRVAGFIARKPVHVLKLAMLISLSKRSDRIIHVEDIKRALAMVESLEPGVRRLFCAVGRNEFAPITHRIIEQLVVAAEAGVTVRDLLERNLGDLDAEELYRTLTTIKSLRMARTVPGTDGKAGSTTVYAEERAYEYIKGDWVAEAEG